VGWIAFGTEENPPRNLALDSVWAQAWRIIYGATVADDDSNVKEANKHLLAFLGSSSKFIGKLLAAYIIEYKLLLPDAEPDWLKT
jgi:hypothetical protein